MNDPSPSRRSALVQPLPHNLQYRMVRSQYTIMPLVSKMEAQRLKYLWYLLHYLLHPSNVQLQSKQKQSFTLHSLNQQPQPLLNARALSASAEIPGFRPDPHSLTLAPRSDLISHHLLNISGQICALILDIQTL